MSSDAGRHGRSTVGDAAQQRGWSPASTRPAPGEGRGMTALRAVTYVLVSLVSLVFLASVVYGAVQINRLSNALQQFADPFGASASVPLDEGSPIPGELATYCLEAPADPACGG